MSKNYGYDQRMDIRYQHMDLIDIDKIVAERDTR